ncbi:flagellar hook capping FlgD N-terminal domain-containing protein [Oscillospiraceae bacterium 50-16]
MSDYINDIINRYAAEAAAAGSAARGTQKAGSTDDGYTSWRDEKKGSGAELSFTDMLGLMVAQFQNQTIDNQADTNDMMNQLIQMTMMQGMTKMTTQMEDLTQANILSYSASLVGKEVTVGVKDEEGNLQEIVGTVTAAGTYDGHPVIFIGDKSYLLSSIMAVGKLPEIKDPEKPGEGDGDGTDPDGDGNGTDPVAPPENNGGTESGGGAGDSGGTEGT